MADRDVTIDVIARDKTERGVTSATRNFDKLQRKVKKATDSIPASVAGAFAKLAAGVPPQVVIAGAAIGAVLAAAIGAAVTAAVLLGVGGSVLAAGIAAAAKSPKVTAAWTKFTERGKKAFADFGKPFEGPVAKALETFGDSLDRMAPTIKAMGASIAPVIDKLAPALASMAEKALPGFQIALEASKPLFDTLAKHAPKIGEAITKMLAYISLGAPEANEFLDDMLTVLEKIIVGLGAMILFWAKTYGAIKDAWSGIKNTFLDGVKLILNVLGTIIGGAAKAFGWIPGIGPKLKAAAAEFEAFRIKANAELEKLKDHTVYVRIRTVGGVDRVTSNTGGGRSIDPDGRRAHGGSTMAGRTYLVGERGPELWTAGVNGHVTPNHELGGDTHVYVTIDGQQLEGRIDRVVRESNRGLKRRAGAFAP